MKDSRNADVEIAFGTGIGVATLVETGVIASEGIVTGLVAKAGATTGLTVFANMGAGGATLLGAMGPAGWAVAGFCGLALVAHGIYRGT